MWLFIIILCIGIVIWLENLYYRRNWDKNVRADVSFSTNRAVEGETIELIEVVEHSGRLPLPWLTLKFQLSCDILLPDSSNASVTDFYNREDVFSIKRGERITRRLPAVCSKRGHHRVNSVDMLSSDLFLTQKLVRNLTSPAYVTVYPRMTELPEIEDHIRSIMGDFVVRRALNQDPFFFKGVRDYMPGDQIKHINWKATARTGELEVNEFDYTSSKYASVFLDVENEYLWIDHNIHEEAIRMAATIIDSMIADGIPVGLRSNAADCVTGEYIDLIPGNSADHCDSCLTALARIELVKDPPSIMKFIDRLFEKSDTDELIIVISSSHSDQLIEKLRELDAMEDRSLMFIRLARFDDDREFEELNVLRHSCVWRVDCD